MDTGQAEDRSMAGPFGQDKIKRSSSRPGLDGIWSQFLFYTRTVVVYPEFEVVRVAEPQNPSAKNHRNEGIRLIPLMFIVLS